MAIKNRRARCCNRRYGDDFSALSMAARVELYEQMLFDGVIQPDVHSLLVGLSAEERHEVLLECALVNAILKDAQAPSPINVFDD